VRAGRGARLRLRARAIPHREVASRVREDARPSRIPCGRCRSSRACVASGPPCCCSRSLWPYRCASWPEEVADRLCQARLPHRHT
jgi:hypothetical protein